MWDRRSFFVVCHAPRQTTKNDGLPYRAMLFRSASDRPEFFPMSPRVFSLRRYRPKYSGMSMPIIDQRIRQVAQFRIPILALLEFACLWIGLGFTYILQQYLASRSASPFRLFRLSLKPLLTCPRG